MKAMKTLYVLALIAALAIPAHAQSKEQDRVENAGSVIKEIMDIPDDIPQNVIDKADCVVVLPSVLKAAFIVGASYGRAGSFALKKATTAALNSRWNAARSKPTGSRQISGAYCSSRAVQGARNAKWPAFDTT